MTAKNNKTTIRLPVELDKKLAEYASKEELSKNQVIKKAVRKLLAEKEKVSTANSKGGEKCY